jgi:hypothetical protein
MKEGISKMIEPGTYKTIVSGHLTNTVPAVTSHPKLRLAKKWPSIASLWLSTGFASDERCFQRYAMTEAAGRSKK